MRVLVTGANGQVGVEVCRTLTLRGLIAIPMTRNDANLMDEKSMEQFVQSQNPDAVIHTAAYTAVDRAEDEPDLCYAVNVEGTKNIITISAKNGWPLLFLSTDYVFDGKSDRPYREDDAMGPLNVYGQSKAEAESLVRKNTSQHFIVRTSWVFGECGENFVKTMLQIGAKEETVRVVGDQIGSPTYAADLANILCDLIQTKKYGTYHVTNEGYVSWAEFAETIFVKAGLDCRVERVSSSDFVSKAKRPKNGRLSTCKLQENGFSLLPPWQDALDRFLAKING